MEPLEVPAFLEKTKRATGSSSLRRFISTGKKCDNSYVDFKIEGGKIIFVYQDTQGGKTAGMEYMAITGALDNKMLPIIFTMNRRESIKSLRASIAAKNKLIEKICEIAEIKDVPSLEFFELEEIITGHYNLRAKQWLQDGLGPIPVLAVMPNDTKLEILVKKVIPHIAGTPMRDINGNLPILLLVDEADQIFKSPDNTTKSEEYLNKEVDLGAQGTRESLFASVSTTAYITATQVAVASNIDLSSHRREDCIVIEPVLSELNWQYRCKAGHRNKVIYRKYLTEKKESEDGGEAKGKDNCKGKNKGAAKGEGKANGDTRRSRGKEKKTAVQKALENQLRAENLYARVVEVVDDMVKCAHYRALLISCTSLYENDARIEAARTLVEKSGMEPGVVVFSWSNNLLNIWTKDSTMITTLKALKDHKGTARLAIKGTKEGAVEFETKKLSYRQLLKDFNHALKGKDVILKIIIFSNGMTERSVSVKGTDHCCPLTDMYVAGDVANMATMVQRCGRLAGSAKDDYRRTLWAGKAIHEFLDESFRVNDIHVQSLKDGFSVQDSCREVQAEAAAAAEGTEVGTKRKVFFAISSKNDRAGAIKRGMVAKQDAQKIATNKKCRLVDTSPENEEPVLEADDLDFLLAFGTETTATASIDPEGSNVPLVVEGHVEDKQANQEATVEPDETVPSFVKQHREKLVEIFREEVYNLPEFQGYKVSAMANKMAEHKEFPDGCPFEAVEIVKYIKDHEFGLLQDALVWFNLKDECFYVTYT